MRWLTTEGRDWSDRTSKQAENLALTETKWLKQPVRPNTNTVIYKVTNGKKVRLPNRPEVS